VVTKNDLIGQLFRCPNLFRGNRRAVKVDRTCIGAKVKGNGPQSGDALEGLRQHVLAGVLLGVVAAASRVDRADDFTARQRSGSIQQVVDCVTSVNDVGDWHALEPAEIIRLTTGRWIKGGSVELNRYRSVPRDDGDDSRAKLQQPAVMIVKTLGQGEVSSW
jgi:hypothetical protein